MEPMRRWGPVLLLVAAGSPVASCSLILGPPDLLEPDGDDGRDVRHDAEDGGDADGGDADGGDADGGDADGGDRDDGDGDADVAAVCGNGVTEPGEDCDDRNADDDDGCTYLCLFTCHDAAECDDDDQCTADSCEAGGTGRLCVNEIYAGVACDDGNECTEGETCDAEGACGGGTDICRCTTTDDCARHEDGNHCNGTLVCEDEFCVIDPATVITCDPSGDTECRRNTCDPPTGICWMTDVADGTDCDDGLFCTPTDACRSGACLGSGTRCPDGPCNAGCSEDEDRCLPAPAATVCRASAGTCDPEELCDGSSTFCPGDSLHPAGHECRASEGPCDPAETCDGWSVDCPVDVLRTAGDECRASGGPCDPAEACDGSSASCPANVVRPAGYECRAGAGDCDVAEACDGSSPGCPADLRRTAGFVCRTAVGDCDQAETCDGSSPDCPANGLVDAGTECRGAVQPCDAPEACSGSSTDCPADLLQPAGHECRAVAGDCDAPETCDGSTAGCPAEVRRPAGFECRAALGSCDVAETCTGSSDDCPTDTHRPDGAPCEDGNSCTSPDACDDDGTCVGGPLPPPGVPGVLAPENGARTGSPHAPALFNVLRPLFRRRAPTDDGCGAPTYDIQVDDSCATPGFASCAFPSPEASAAGIADLAWRPPSDLGVDTTPPVGRRFYWRARACRGAACWSWSPVRYVDVGRTPRDFNGDGFADVVVGAPDNDDGGSGAGQVYFHLGGATFGTTAAAAAVGAPGEGLGWSLAAAGDVDGNGFADVLAGSPLSDAAGSDAGQAHLYLGRSPPDGIADVNYAGGAAGDQFGTAVAILDPAGGSRLLAGHPQWQAALPPRRAGRRPRHG